MPRRRPDGDARSAPVPSAVVPFPEPSGSTPPRGTAQPDDEETYVLLRIPVLTATWAEDLPPLPSGLRVTAAFSDPEVAAEHGDALALLGYEPVGARAGEPDDHPTVDLLIPRSACDGWPRWRDQLLTSGGRVWDLSFGPVAAMLGPAVAVHHRALAG